MKGNNVQTLDKLIQAHGVNVDEHLDRDDLVPVTAGLQRQGDVLVLPTPKGRLGERAWPVPAQGIAVVRGENGGNTHLLLASGEVLYSEVESRNGGLDIAVFVVTEGAVAYLAHPEHGYAGIAPGTYTVRRQREQADEIRMVAD